MTKGAPNTKDTVPKDFHLTHGRVSSCKDGIIETEGLLNAPAGEIVELVGKDVKGIVINAGTAPVKILVLKWADGVTVDSDDFIRRRGFLDNGRGWNAITRWFVKNAGRGRPWAYRALGQWVSVALYRLDK